MTPSPNHPIKQLEWRRGYRDDTVTISQADAIGGIYQVRVLNGVVWLDAPGKQTVYPSEDDAKVAAQADFESAILPFFNHPITPADEGEAGMIEVISKGNKRPEDRIYRNTCNHCGSLLQFQASDARSTFDRDGNSFVIVCPVCKHDVWTAHDAYQNKPMTDADINALARRMGA